MKESIIRSVCYISKAILTSIALVTLTATQVLAQSATDADAIQKRLMRARALAAAHNLTAAAAELDSIRNTATDDSMRDVARIMLMGVYLEAADYTRALALLEETYNARSRGKEGTIRAYYTLAGQSVTGAREHLDRYRAFGINVADRELPPEAAGDLDRLRTLLERVAEQARQICGEDSTSTEAVALLEDVAGVRATLARNREERQQWQGETASARQKLAVSETRIASTGSVPVRPAVAQSTAPLSSGANNAPAQTTADTVAQARPTPLTRKTVSIPEARPPKPSNQNEPPRSTPSAGSSSNSQPVDAGSLIDKATQRVAPSYPSTARNARVTGIVKVFVLVDENGAVAKVERSDGPTLLRGAAENAARMWKFKPAVVDGQPVRMSGFISFNFTL